MSQTEENKSNEEQKEQTGENKSNEEKKEEKEVKEEEILDSQTNKNIETEHEKENNENQEINKNNQNNQNKEGDVLIPSESKYIPSQNSNNYDYEKNKKEIMEKIELRKYQADVVEKYINETGIGSAFQIVFSELLSKKVPVDKYYAYAASRLRQLGREKAANDKKKEKNNNK